MLASSNVALSFDSHESKTTGAASSERVTYHDRRGCRSARSCSERYPKARTQRTERFFPWSGHLSAGPEEWFSVRRDSPARTGSIRSKRSSSEGTDGRSSPAGSLRLSAKQWRAVRPSRLTGWVHSGVAVTDASDSSLKIRPACSSLMSKKISDVKKLYTAFERKGLRPWLDKKKLMPGQNWPRAIETAIQTSDFFVACFSRRSTSKRGSFHSELRYALACASQGPAGRNFLHSGSAGRLRSARAESPSRSNTSTYSRIGTRASGECSE